MKSELKPYPKYRDSGLPWLGKVPEHWESLPTFGVFLPIQEKNTGMKVQTVLSLSYGRIVIKPPEKLHGLVPKSFESYQVINPGDIIIRTTDLQNDKRSLRIGVSNDRGIITSAYLALKPRVGANGYYLFWFLYSWDTTKAIYEYGSGLRQSLAFSDFKRMLIPLPPPTEQAAIAKYLAYATAKIDAAIAAKKKVIALLEEEKRAIIQQAVTKGLDPKAKMKDSGVPWIGEIPEGWEVKRIKYLLREIDSRSTTGLETLLSLRMHQGLVVFADNYSRPPQAASLVGFKLVSPGQFVVNRMQAGNGVIFASSLSGLVSPDYGVFVPIGNANVEFLGELFRCEKVRAKFRAESKGLGTGTSGFMRLYSDRMGAICVALPSPLEQSRILKWLFCELQDTKTRIASVRSEISLLREYRTRLVADLVTGKLDVRAAAAGLPEIDEEAAAVAAGDEELESEEDEDDAEA